MTENLIEYKEMREAIQRVRHLAEVFAKGESDKVTYSGRLVSNEILRALEGEQQ